MNWMRYKVAALARYLALVFRAPASWFQALAIIGITVLCVLPCYCDRPPTPSIHTHTYVHKYVYMVVLLTLFSSGAYMRVGMSACRSVRLSDCPVECFKLSWA